MLLDWDTKITKVLESLGIHPDHYTQDDKLKEWVAQHFTTFLALPAVKDIVTGMASDMLPDHKNFEYHLIVDCISVIVHNFELYNSQEKTQEEVCNLLKYTDDNFSIEGKVLVL